ncbi:MAG TPA: hypothetical protein VII94_01390 [Candidatus Saccharimonadales bacterium]
MNIVETSVKSGNNSYRKFVELSVEGEFNTIQTIVLPEDEWLALNEMKG